MPDYNFGQGIDAPDVVDKYVSAMPRDPAWIMILMVDAMCILILVVDTLCLLACGLYLVMGARRNVGHTHGVEQRSYGDSQLQLGICLFTLPAP